MNRSSDTHLYTRSAVGWSFAEIFALLAGILAFLSNSAVLIMFFQSRQLRTQPFNVYLMWLMSINIVFALVQTPFTIIQLYYVDWCLNVPYTAVYLYVGRFLPAAAMNTHLMVTCNRIWAMTFPFSYLRFHSIKCAVLLCSCVWLYVNCVVFPAYVTDVQSFTDSYGKRGCREEFSNVPIQVIVFMLPVLAILGAYPLIFYKQRKRMVTVRHLEVTTVAGFNQRSPNLGIDVSAPGKAAGIFDKEVLARSTPIQNISKKLESKRSASYSFKILTAMTCCVVVCWGPFLVLRLVTAVTLVFHLRLQAILMGFRTIQPVLDPVLFTFVVRGVPSSVTRMFHRE